MALGGGSPAGREIQHQFPSCQEEPSAPTPTFPPQEGPGSARRGSRGKPSRAGKEAASLSPLAVLFEVWLEAVSVLRTSLPCSHFPGAQTQSQGFALVRWVAKEGAGMGVHACKAEKKGEPG